MISEIRLTNFKCFKDLKLPIAMFTLLAGLNGMGKSSIIQSILLLRQSWRSGNLRNGRLELNGELAKLGTGSDILFEGADADHVRISLDLFKKTENTFHSLKKIDFWYFYDNKSDNLTSILPDPKLNYLMKSILKNSNFKTEAELIQNITSLNTLNSLANQSEDDQLKLAIREVRDTIDWINTAEREKISPFSSHFHYVFSERFGPRQVLPLSESHIIEKNMGLHGEYVLHFLLEYGKKIVLEIDDPRLLNSSIYGYNLEGQVDAWLQEFSPGSHLSVEAIRRADSVLTGFVFDRPGDVKTRPFRATNVGFGLSYVMPVLVALLSSEKGALVLLENPEAHMHPRGQTRLGQLAARAAAAGIQVIMETHSDHVMNGVRIDIRNGGKGRLKSTDAAFHYFERDGTESHVTSPEIGEDGRLDSWPPGFFDQHDENLIELLAPRVKR
ncbi:DUF3696 domain-containing protein [Janthinobacterium sp. J1-1]|uniref:AAA family ATPase n=1 Tax=Janthinobacterium sp. J1-1 TaxID=3065910 RepID=UPI0028121152|nr:DUF3696 domain-containing protein [Janthinobacterium sp. J1-1]